MAKAVALVRDSNQRLRACWSQRLQPAQQELERRLREWESRANDMPFAVEGARRAEAAARDAEQPHARAHQRAVLAKGNHDAAWSKLLTPRLPGEDYGPPVAAEHRARVAYGIATRNLENTGRRLETARVAASRAGDLVGGCMVMGDSLESFGRKGGWGARICCLSLACLKFFRPLTTHPRPLATNCRSSLLPTGGPATTARCFSRVWRGLCESIHFRLAALVWPHLWPTYIACFGWSPQRCRNK